MSELINHQDIKPQTNYVLVLPDEEMIKYHLNGKETGIYVGKSYMKYVDENDSLDFETAENVDTQAHHWPISGTVITAPQKNVFYGHDIHRYKRGISPESLTPDDLQKLNKMTNASSNVQSPVEVKTGDRVMFDYMMNILCYQNGMYFNTDIGTLFLIRYDNLIGKIVDKEITPLNGNIFFEWEKPKSIGSFDALDIEIYEAKGVQKGKVTHRGTNLRYFLQGSNLIDFPTEFNPGETILFKPEYCSMIESQMHLSIFDGREIYTIKRHDVLAKIEQQE